MQYALRKEGKHWWHLSFHVNFRNLCFYYFINDPVSTMPTYQNVVECFFARLWNNLLELERNLAPYSKNVVGPFKNQTYLNLKLQGNPKKHLTKLHKWASLTNVFWSFGTYPFCRNHLLICNALIFLNFSFGTSSFFDCAKRRINYSVFGNKSRGCL